ncbi:MAG: hypothetical protein NXH78_06955 [Hyphomonadaceae bacterium]|nr:hypothetical protein [Hyphomonadaceae bacterium]
MTLTRLKIAWVVFLTALFVWFSAWYGGAGKPISIEEGERLLEQIRQTYESADDSERRFLANIEDMIPRDDGREFYAVNLENLKDGPEAEASDRAYAGVVMPLLFKRASHPVFLSNRVGLMLGDYGTEVDRVAVVRYRSLRDMIEMTLEPAMKAGEGYKFGALNHTEVFITRPTITFVHVRVTLALLLILIGWLGLRGMTWFSRRRAAQ